MPEALEKWPVAVLGKLLPRHLEIIDKIDTIWKDSLKVRSMSATLAATATSHFISIFRNSQLPRFRRLWYLMWFTLML